MHADIFLFFKERNDIYCILDSSESMLQVEGSVSDPQAEGSVSDLMKQAEGRVSDPIKYIYS